MNHDSWRKGHALSEAISAVIQHTTPSTLARKAAATDPIAVPQIPRKWKLVGAPITLILYAASEELATETVRFVLRSLGRQSVLKT